MPRESEYVGHVAKTRVAPTVSHEAGACCCNKTPSAGTTSAVTSRRALNDEEIDGLMETTPTRDDMHELNALTVACCRPEQSLLTAPSAVTNCAMTSGGGAELEVAEEQTYTPECTTRARVEAHELSAQQAVSCQGPPWQLAPSAVTTSAATSGEEDEMEDEEELMQSEVRRERPQQSEPQRRASGWQAARERAIFGQPPPSAVTNTAVTNEPTEDRERRKHRRGTATAADCRRWEANRACSGANPVGRWRGGRSSQNLGRLHQWVYRCSCGALASYVAAMRWAARRGRDTIKAGDGCASRTHARSTFSPSRFHDTQAQWQRQLWSGEKILIALPARRSDAELMEIAPA